MTIGVVTLGEAIIEAITEVVIEATTEAITEVVIEATTEAITEVLIEAIATRRITIEATAPSTIVKTDGILTTIDMDRRIVTVAIETMAIVTVRTTTTTTETTAGITAGITAATVTDICWAA